MRNYVYYLVAIASNHPQHQARYAAIIHAAPQWGQVIAFGVDASEAPFIQVTGIYISIITVVLALASYGVFKHTTETLWGTEEGVIVPLEEANKLALAKEEVEPVDEKTDAKETTTVQVLAAK
jgi:ABC-type branched-subunit amino acid transport system permease subunit